MMMSMKLLFNYYFMSAVHFSFCIGEAVMVTIFASYSTNQTQPNTRVNPS